jgi:hypothetical protein
MEKDATSVTISMFSATKPTSLAMMHTVSGLLLPLRRKKTRTWEGERGEREGGGSERVR